MTLELTLVDPAAAEALVPVLRDAEEGDDRIRATIADPRCKTYAARSTGELVGAAVVRLSPGEPTEIVYIAIAGQHRRRGHGRGILAALQAGYPDGLIVGTANSSLDNIAFYQVCGFRMLRVHRDFFAYIDPPIVEHGITMRDMIVFSYERGRA
ncbi:GNAT family N-acetyltransferase [Dactylosporangium sp. CS-033363]|uniref:GNAT family N-acetyltransferase n=1 Tax=Dactylosporangium sp. CS-033363 TaxID=3239935 RepID=UPI003D90487E